MPLNEFSNNVAHSTNEESLKITEYNPTQKATIKNFKSYLINKGHIQVSGSSNVDASKTLLDSELTSPPFPMSGTTVVTIQDEEENPIKNGNQDADSYQRASNPTDVFNLQSSPSLLE